MNFSKLRKPLIGMSTLCIALGVSTAVAHGDPKKPPPPPPLPAGSVSVALGSSFAAGPGVPTTIDPVCGRSDHNYAHLVASTFSTTLTDVSCSGSTTANILTTPQQTAAGLKAPQIQAVTADTKLVTITTGGNDVSYLPNLIAQSCVNNPAPVDAAIAAAPIPDAQKPLVKLRLCTVTPPDAVQAALNGVEGQLEAVINAARTAAPQARIVVVDYLTILPRDNQPCAALSLTKDQIKYYRDVARQLRQATKQATKNANVDLVKLAKNSRDHNVCSRDPWVTSYQFGPDFFAGGVVPYHPNAAGMQAAAALVTQKISGNWRDDPWDDDDL